MTSDSYYDVILAKHHCLNYANETSPVLQHQPLDTGRSLFYTLPDFKQGR